MTEANDYDFEKVDDSLKCLKGVLVESLRTVNICIWESGFDGILIIFFFSCVLKFKNAGPTSSASKFISRGWCTIPRRMLMHSIAGYAMCQTTTAHDTGK